MEEIKMEQRIIDAIKACTKKQIEITLETNLRDDLEFDSFDIIMLINELEVEFNINIVEGNFADIQTVSDIVNQLKGVTAC